VHATGALVLADVSDVAEGVAAAETGADAVAGTLSLFRAGARGDGPDFDLVAQLVARVGVPVIAEGRYGSAADVAHAFALGAHAVVAGYAITSPLALTRRMVAGTPRTVTLGGNVSDFRR
jgi:N-acylglucosamine-6-phosphate 2-epimerase